MTPEQRSPQQPSDALQRLLLVVRHGQAVDPREVEVDAQRPLTPRGERDAAAAGRWLRSAGHLPELVLASSALRTRATAGELGAGLALEPDEAQPQLCSTDALYQAGAQAVLQLVAGTDPAVRRLALVGHEPACSQLVRALTGRDLSFPTSAVAVLAVEVPWSALAAGEATLLGSWTPKG